MGKAILCYEIMPESVDAMGEVEAGLKKLNPSKMEKKPFAFGLSAFEVTFVIEDEAGADTDIIDKKLEGIKGVGSVKNTAVTLA
jgi:translation elongation factor EF-1beta